MKNAILRNGIYACLVILVGFTIEYFMGKGKEVDYGASETIGYLILSAAMIFVFFGIRQYRDQENKGQLTFVEGLKIGALIVLLPSLVFGLYNVVYVLWLDPDFMNDYFAYSLDQLKASLPPAEYAIKKQELLAQKETFTNPFVNFAVMFLTVFIMGFIVSIISSFALMKPTVEG